jgi:hypothetical protein
MATSKRRFSNATSKSCSSSCAGPPRSPVERVALERKKGEGFARGSPTRPDARRHADAVVSTTGEGHVQRCAGALRRRHESNRTDDTSGPV